MKSKICGISDPKTLKILINHNYPPEYIGFIVNYPKSIRFIKYDNLKNLLKINKKKSKYVAVLVKPNENILEKISLLPFDYYQIYGCTPKKIKFIKDKYKKKIIVAITVNNQKDVLQYQSFKGLADIFLFDSKGYEKSFSFNHQLVKDLSTDLRMGLRYQFRQLYRALPQLLCARAQHTLLPCPRRSGNVRGGQRPRPRLGFGCAESVRDDVCDVRPEPGRPGADQRLPGARGRRRSSALQLRLVLWSCAWLRAISNPSPARRPGEPRDQRAEGDLLCPVALPRRAQGPRPRLRQPGAAGHGGAAGWVARGGLQAGWHGVVAAARPRRTVGELLLLAQRALELAQDVAPVDVGETQLLDLLVLAVLLLLEALDELAGDGLACSG